MPITDLSQVRVPKGALRIEIDDPDKNRIAKPVGIIRGWFASSDLQVPEDFHFQIGASTVPHQVLKRTDVEAALPDYTITGFKIPYDLAPFLPYITNHRLLIHLVLPGFDPCRLWFTIQDRALAICVAAASDLSA
jgi:hypothetical protein